MCPQPHPTPDTATPRVHQYGAVASVLSAHFHPHIEKPMPHWQCQCWPVAMAGASQNPPQGELMLGEPHPHEPYGSALAAGVEAIERKPGRG